MADANDVPRRFSMAYILGFSDKPYKETITPGRIMEWTASDGRKGRLTSAYKPRLTAASLAKVPSEKRSTKEALCAKSTSKKAHSNKPATDCVDTSVKDGTKKPGLKNGGKRVVDDTGNGNSDPLATTRGNTEDAPDGNNKNGGTKNLTADELPTASGTADAPVTTDTEDKHGGDSNPHGFTQEQDEKLLKWKAENANKPWTDFAGEIDKQVPQCKQRFHQIKPKDWNPNASKPGGGAKGGEGKKEKNKDKTAKHNRKQNSEGADKNDQKGNQEADTKEEEKKDENDLDELWGTFGADFAIGTNDDKKDDGWGNKVEEGCTTGGGDLNENKDTGTGQDIGDLWGPTPVVDAVTPNWDTTDNQSTKNAAGVSQGFDNSAWPTAPKSASRPASNTAPSRARSQHDASNKDTQPMTTHPLEIEVKPDDTFSADDLRLVARILQQDCSMVWNRVSWRFKDKTGRTLHPDDFEKKITGRIEGKNSEKGEQRR